MQHICACSRADVCEALEAAHPSHIYFQAKTGAPAAKAVPGSAESKLGTGVLSHKWFPLLPIISHKGVVIVMI